jgi:hypothetical protein
MANKVLNYSGLSKVINKLLSLAFSISLATQPAAAAAAAVGSNGGAP